MSQKVACPTIQQRNRHSGRGKRVAHVPSYKEFKAAEARLKESVIVCSDLPDHTYPKKVENLRTIKRFVDYFGLPPEGGRGFLRWLLGGGR